MSIVGDGSSLPLPVIFSKVLSRRPWRLEGGRLGPPYGGLGDFIPQQATPPNAIPVRVRAGGLACKGNRNLRLRKKLLEKMTL